MRRLHGARSAQAERGAVLVLSALAITALFLIVAIVIDLGSTRSDRRGGQLAVDNAASSAGHVLGESSAFEACQAALDYLRITLDTAPFTGGDCATFIFSAAVPCDDDVPRSDTWTSGDFTVTLEHPVVDLSPLMDSASTINATGIGVDHDTDGVGCERFGVQVETSGNSYFGGIAGQSERTSRVHAVALSHQPDPTVKVVPAFLMLDRTACQAIHTLTGAGSAGGTYPDGTARPDGIFVSSNGEQPGIIHSDSDASGCSSNHVIDASQPAGTLKTIYVEQLNDDEPGIISVVADERRGTGGINVPATGGDVVSRTPVDNLYQSAITSLHTQAYTSVTATGQPVNSNRYNCTGDAIGPVDPAFTTAYIDCDTANGFTSPLTGPTTVVFKRDVSLGNGQRILLPTAQTVVVRGGISVSGGGGGGGNWASFHLPDARVVHVGGRVTVSNGNLTIGAPAPGGVPVEDPTCAATPPTSRLTVFSPAGNSDPALETSGILRLCATSVYLAGEKISGNSTYSELSIPSAARPTATPSEGGAGCTSSLPCPWVTGNPAQGARYFIRPGADVVWQAPNLSSSPLADNMPLPSFGGIEDLSLWAEGGNLTDVRNATLHMTGVFYSPNSLVELRSGNASTVPVDAQFIARILVMRAGRFSMRPSLANAVPVPAQTINNLIR